MTTPKQEQSIDESLTLFPETDFFSRSFSNVNKQMTSQFDCFKTLWLWLKFKAFSFYQVIVFCNSYHTFFKLFCTIFTVYACFTFTRLFHFKMENMNEAMRIAENKLKSPLTGEVKTCEYMFITNVIHYILFKSIVICSDV